MKELLVLFVVMFVFIGCSGSGSGSGSGIKANFNFVQAKSLHTSVDRSTHRAIVATYDDETFYKEELKTGNRGNMIGSYSPTSFVLSLNDIYIYNKNQNEAIKVLSHISAGKEHHNIPRHVDLVYSRNFIRDFYLNSTINEWDGFMINFLPSISSSNNFIQRSYMKVELGDEYNGIVLKNETTIVKNDNPNIHIFEFKEVMPYDIYFLSYIIFGKDIESFKIQNPEGEMGKWPIITNLETQGNSSQVFIPTTTNIKLDDVNTSFNIDFNWDTTDLIEVYDNNTPSDFSDDTITLKLSNPFPISFSLSLDSNSSDSLVTNDGQISDVSSPTISGLDKKYTLIWTNPTDVYFDYVTVIRKETTMPTGKEDGEVVYEGYEPAFYDDTSSLQQDYYYLIYVSDIFGNESKGIVMYTGAERINEGGFSYIE